MSMETPDDAPQGEIAVVHVQLTAELAVTLPELCRLCGAHTEYVLELIELGVVEPVHGSGPGDWQFHSIAVRRSLIAMRLQSGLDVNPPGAALILDLLDELAHMRARVRVLEQLGDI